MITPTEEFSYTYNVIIIHLLLLWMGRGIVSCLSNKHWGIVGVRERIYDKDRNKNYEREREMEREKQREKEIERNRERKRKLKMPERERAGERKGKREAI